MTKARSSADFAAGGFYAGKNAIINGDFFVNQRNFTSTTTSATFGFDRFYLQRGGGGTVTYSAQTFTPGTAPVAGYEAANFARLVTTSQSATSDYSLIRQKIENVRTFAGQTVTVSAWIKAGSNGQLANFSLTQDFGSGGSSEIAMKGANLTLTTSWVRYTTTFSVPSLSGKTIGTGSSLSFYVWSSAGSDLTNYSNVGNQNATIDIWGVQVEAGSTATAFQTATGTIQGELAACQRYYWRANSASNAFTLFALGYSDGPNSALMSISIPSYMRVFPTSIDFSNTAIQEAIGGALNSISSFTISAGGSSSPNNNIVFQANTSGLTNGRTARLLANNSLSAFIGFNAEL
jgi:hypothetical protein